jgi:hypothetical protein
VGGVHLSHVHVFFWLSCSIFVEHLKHEMLMFLPSPFSAPKWGRCWVACGVHSQFLCRSRSWHVQLPVSTAYTKSPTAFGMEPGVLRARGYRSNCKPCFDIAPLLRMLVFSELHFGVDALHAQ